MPSSWYPHTRPAEDVTQMLSLRQEGFSYAAIGQKFEISRQRVQQILSYAYEGYKEMVRQRANGRCEICGLPEDEHCRKLTYHHKEPITEGYNKPDNILLVCISCHRVLHIGQVVRRATRRQQPTQNQGGTMAIVRRNISLPVELDAKLTKQAIEEDRKISAIVKRALERYLKEVTDNA